MPVNWLPSELQPDLTWGLPQLVPWAICAAPPHNLGQPLHQRLVLAGNQEVELVVPAPQWAALGGNENIYLSIVS